MRAACSAMKSWVVITGGGSGIGRGLVHHFCRDYPVLTCGRRLEALEETRRLAGHPEAIVAVACDIGTEEGRSKLLAALPGDAPVKLLVQNAAIGDPSPLASLDIAHFEEALRVNVVAPLALTQALVQQMVKGSGRVLHLGTSVAHNPQPGTATYGVTKAAFHRLYQQLNAEGIGVPVGSLSPGLVDTEGVRDHVQKARNLDLPHVKFFDQAFEKGWTTDMQQLIQLVDELVAMDAERFTSQEWRFSEWRKQCLEQQ
eukprot:TRINITY_DN64322_c0_g1_i1.p1 TRINITY_DN64322_c0_g1~~TRINITY_DN64322_c0_g1_i1.p1  ORF type:complete len:257 (-),score=49.18 TRINITY_DN64322_c0_g1_i1:60-830(-)